MLNNLKDKKISEYGVKLLEKVGRRVKVEIPRRCTYTI